MPHRKRDNIRLAGVIAMVLTALALAGPGAAAATCQAPPGTAGIEQYCEQVPGPGGDRPPTDRGTHPGAGIPTSTRHALAAHGATGQGVLGMTDFGHARSGAGGHRVGVGAGGRTDSPSSNPFAAISTAIADGATSSAAYVTLLALLTVLLCAVAWGRYRRRGSPGNRSGE
jgi:hypothetical protein